MRVKAFKYNEDKFVQVYLEAEERENQAILKNIDEIKKKNSNVAIFVNGTNDTLETIRSMLNFEKNSSNGLNYR